MADLSGRRILIVEDEIMIALALQDTLEELGCVVIGIAQRIEQGLRLIHAHGASIDAATLDVRLGDTTSYDIACALDARGIPFVITSGYDNASQLIGYEKRPMLRKPYHRDALEQALKGLFA